MAPQQPGHPDDTLLPVYMAAACMHRSSFNLLHHWIRLCPAADAGIHGPFDAELGLLEHEPTTAIYKLVTLAVQARPEGGVAVTLTPTNSTTRMRGHVPGDLSYLQLLLDGSKVSYCVPHIQNVHTVARCQSRPSNPGQCSLCSLCWHAR